ncbi:nucleotidyltransferase domain-containing protein [Bacillaceae bacterium CLA-AA-H227]|uniref:Nucleotidyltransferase domain-containing protein n=1 Tax=Robertmurraya yapensis (ex Hitch et al 2024) TaxID=3133160 RepID=A0ACC6SFM5_9BACI
MNKYRNYTVSEDNFMVEWQIALEDFIKEWKDRNDVVGALVCGSYITGNPSKRSDIDVHIVLSDEVEWRERGNRAIHGFLIEYFANPQRQIRLYFQEDFNSRRTMSMVQFMTGRILFDKTGVMSELKAEAKQWLKREYSGLNSTMIEMKKYAIWDAMDNLKDCFEQEKEDFHFVYYNLLAKLFWEYGQFLNIETIPHYQIISYLTDPAYLKKYLKTAFPDTEFKVAFVKAMQLTNRQKMIVAYEELSTHVLTNMGGFQIDGWKLKSDVNI